MEIEQIKDLIVTYEWMAEEPNPLYAEYLLDCLYLLFLYKTEGEEEYLGSSYRKGFKPDIKELNEMIKGDEENAAKMPVLGLKTNEAMRELIVFLEKEEGYIANDSLAKRHAIDKQERKNR